MYGVTLHKLEVCIYVALINQIEDTKVVKESAVVCQPQMVCLVSKKKEETESVAIAIYKNIYFKLQL